MRVGCLRGLVALLLLVTGCHITQEQKEQDVCTAFCDCAVSPSQVAQCITDQCIPVLQPTITDSCLDCVYMNSQTCSALGNQCVDLCLDVQTQPLGGI